MEDSNTNPTVLRKNEGRALVKKCFKNSFFSLVPFEVWRDLIVSNAELHSIVVISQTCHAFEEIVEEIGGKNFNLALMLRKEGQIPLAKKYLLLCAKNNNSTAMFHLGYAFHVGGWKIKQDIKKAAEWFWKSAELGNVAAMAYFADCCKFGLGVQENAESCNLWAKKALSTKNFFALGFCHYWGMAVQQDYKVAAHFFEKSADQGDEFGQYYFGKLCYYGFGVEKDQVKAFYWYLKCAEQGFLYAQDEVSSCYRDGVGCKKDKELSEIWSKKAENQRGK